MELDVAEIGAFGAEPLSFHLELHDTPLQERVDGAVVGRQQSRRALHTDRVGSALQTDAVVVGQQRGRRIRVDDRCQSWA